MGCLLDLRPSISTAGSAFVGVGAILWGEGNSLWRYDGRRMGREAGLQLYMALSAIKHRLRINRTVTDTAPKSLT